ncbi:uncharacterized protein [Parasteatoda tepidariorum]|uniref:uncharacterized protein n=1 Tax=Parasteatoda tepidariorum TaxID=114398 RepID=UPI0039BCF3D0
MRIVKIPPRDVTPQRLNDIEKDLKALKIKNWKGVAMNRRCCSSEETNAAGDELDNIEEDLGLQDDVIGGRAGPEFLSGSGFSIWKIIGWRRDKRVLDDSMLECYEYKCEEKSLHPMLGEEVVENNRVFMWDDGSRQLFYTEECVSEKSGDNDVKFESGELGISNCVISSTEEPNIPSEPTFSFWNTISKWFPNGDPEHVVRNYRIDENTWNDEMFDCFKYAYEERNVPPNLASEVDDNERVGICSLGKDVEASVKLEIFEKNFTPDRGFAKAECKSFRVDILDVEVASSVKPEIEAEKFAHKLGCGNEGGKRSDSYEAAKNVVGEAGKQKKTKKNKKKRVGWFFRKLFCSCVKKNKE